MDLSLSEEQMMFRDMFRDFAEKEIAPRAEHADRQEAPPVEILRKAAAQGFLGATLPEDFGGAAMDQLTFTLLVEEVARHCLSTAVTLSLHMQLGAMTLLEAGTPGQKEGLLPRLAGGELAAFALTEPEAGSDPGSVQTTAQAVDGDFVLDGVKSWVGNGGLAGVTILAAQTAPGRGQEGLSLFVVERGTPGLFLGQREPTLGLRGLDIRTLYLEALELPANSLLGGVNAAWPVIQRAHDRLRLSLAAAALGAAEGALALGVGFAVERKQFGGPIAQKQAIQNYVADCAIEIEGLRHLTHYAAWLADSGQDFGLAASMARSLGGRVAQQTANKMLQVHGGYGFSDEYAISRVYRDVRALRLLGGTDELLRLAVAQSIFEEKGIKVTP